jgi:hypothetical protein
MPGLPDLFERNSARAAEMDVAEKHAAEIAWLPRGIVSTDTASST